jgi:hypothetical protein
LETDKPLVDCTDLIRRARDEMAKLIIKARAAELQEKNLNITRHDKIRALGQHEVLAEMDSLLSTEENSPWWRDRKHLYRRHGGFTMSVKEHKHDKSQYIGSITYEPLDITASVQSNDESDAAYRIDALAGIRDYGVDQWPKGSR